MRGEQVGHRTLHHVATSVVNRQSGLLSSPACDAPEGRSSLGMTSGSDQQERERRRSRVPLPLAVALLLVLVPFVVLVVRLLLTRYFAMSDLALIELRVRDVGGPHTPLVGVYSRYGWNHPGPLLFYLLAVPYRLLGSTGSALLVGGTLMNLMAAALCPAFFWRRGGRGGLAIGMVVLFVLLRSLGGDFLIFPWNPFAIVLPLLVLAFVVWSIACGDHWMLPIAVALASFCIQSHVGSVAAAVALLAIAAAAVGYDTWRGAASGTLRTSLIAIVVGVLVWVPPIVDEFRPNGGNLSALWRYWTAPHHSVTGWARGGRIVASQLSLPAPWMTSHERTAPFLGGLAPTWQFPWALILVIAALALAWRRRDRDSFSLALVALVFAATAWVSAARIVDEPYGYLLRWTWLVGALAWLAIGWTAMRALTDIRLPTRVARAATVLAAATTIALVAATTMSSVRTQVPDLMAERELRHLKAALIQAAREYPGPIRVESAADIPSVSLSEGIVLQLDHQGIPAGLSEALGARGAGDNHVVAQRDARTLLTAVADDKITAYRNDPRYRLIASYDSLSTVERHFVDGITTQLQHLKGESLTAAQVWAEQHPADWKRYSNLNAQSDRAALFLASPKESGRPPPGG